MHPAVLSHSPSGLWGWVPYHFSSDPGPRNDQRHSGNLRAYSVTLRPFALQFSVFPRLVQSVSLYIDMKMMRPLKLLCFTLWFSHHLLKLIENSQCSESWEIFPLELHRLPVDPIQIFEITCSQKPFDPAFPEFVWFITDASQTQHWVGKDVGFWHSQNWTALSVNRVVSFHTSCVQSIVVSPVIFCLIRDQALSHLK